MESSGDHSAFRRPQDARLPPPEQLRHASSSMDYGLSKGYGGLMSRVHPSQQLERELQRPRIGHVMDSECCADQRTMVTRRLDDDDDERDGSSASGEGAIPDGLTSEEIVAFKKARRKEQCRVNQANYRKRKRAFEQQMGREIGVLREEIRELTATRNLVRSQVKAKPVRPTSPPDPIGAVSGFYQHFVGAIESASRSRSVASLQIDTIAGLQHEHFESFDELFDQWQAYASCFEVFKVVLVSVRGTRIGESVIVTAEVELNSSTHSQAQAQRLGHRSSPVVSCSVLQRFVFDGNHQDLAAIVSEVDWIPALADSRASPYSQIRSAVELVRESPQRYTTTPLARRDTA